MSDWVRFHRELRQGEKRGLPRAVRFVYLELSQEARPRKGVIVLPRGMGDVDGVHDILGGNRQEVEEAIRLLTAEPDPMMRLGTRDGKRVLEIVNWEKWNASDLTGADRQKRFRSERKAAADDTLSVTVPTVTPTVTVTETSNGGVTLPVTLPVTVPVTDVTATLSVTVTEPEESRSDQRSERSPFLSSDPSEQDLSLLGSQDLSAPAPAREASPSSTPPVALVQPSTRPTNAMADGVFGMAVQSFGQGVSEATGKPFVVPRGGLELAKLVDALVVHCPAAAKREAWAKCAGRDFAGSGHELSVHRFVDWLNGGRQPRRGPAGAPAASVATKPRKYFTPPPVKVMTREEMEAIERAAPPEYHEMVREGRRMLKNTS